MDGTAPDQPQSPLLLEPHQAPQDQKGWEARNRLEALGAHLRGRCLTVEPNGDGGLAVIAPGSDRPAQSVIACRRRPSDNDRYWYWDGTTPITEAAPEHIPDAGARVAANLHRRQQS